MHIHFQTKLSNMYTLPEILHGSSSQEQEKHRAFVKVFYRKQYQ